MNYDDFIGLCERNYDQGFPFAIYSSPTNHEVTGHFQNNDSVFTCSDGLVDAFVFMPFKLGDTGFCIPFAEATTQAVHFEPNSNGGKINQLSEETSAKNEHVNLVEKALNVIRDDKARKIVISRKKTVPIEPLDLKLLIQDIFQSDIQAFRFVWFHPQTGLWCGATPEVLMRAEDGMFETMSLAGTRGYVPGNIPVWTEKEKEEQRLVTEYIVDRLQKVTKVVKVSNTYDHRAGSLFHLRSDIKGVLKSGTLKKVLRVAELLHPTPAVCGIPLKETQNFILDSEGYDREFYTGYLGYTNEAEKNATFYVNLRCMKVEDGFAHLYVGGGITLDSDPESEWIETQNKLATMLRVIGPQMKSAVS